MPIGRPSGLPFGMRESSGGLANAVKTAFAKPSKTVGAMPKGNA
jgi:hypothetical protein